MPMSTTSESIAPVVTMWRDGLTVIPLASLLPNRAPEYLTLDQAHAAGAIAVEEAPTQTVPTVDATTKAASVLPLAATADTLAEWIAKPLCDECSPYYHGLWGDELDGQRAARRTAQNDLAHRE